MKTFTKFLSGVAIAGLFLFFVLSGCSNPATQNEQVNAGVVDTVPRGVALTPETQDLLFTLPTPIEVTSKLVKAKAGYFFKLTNPPANVETYTTEISKSLNLGVYSADLCYGAVYNLTGETINFLACTNKLADELGITGVYDQSLPGRVKKFSNNNDSLIDLINALFSQTNKFLAANNRTKVAVLVAVGGYAEGLYLAASLGKIATDNTRIMAVIASQKDNHMKLLTILDAYHSDSTMHPVTGAIASLKPIWGNYDIESGKKIAQQKAAEISGIAENVHHEFIKSGN